MGILERQGDGTRFVLAAHGIVGRSSACAVRLEATRSSAEHARLSYGDGRWSVRDLGSRNGTFLNGARLEPSRAYSLAVGDELTFGDPNLRFKMTDISPPVAMARRLAADELVTARGGVLALPSPEDPRICVVEAGPGVWLAEVDGASVAALDGDVLSVDGEAYMLHLPAPVPSTVDDAPRATALEDVTLRLRVSADEETVELSLLGPTGAAVLTPRAHHYTLLLLARARLGDKASPNLGPAQRGWMAVDDLCRKLAVDETRVNVEIYRIRQDMASAGIADGAAVIERRRGSRQLRIGTERVVIESIPVSGAPR